MPNEIDTASMPVNDPSRGGTGTLTAINIGDHSVKFRHESVLGQERKLTADPIELSGSEWKMFVDRGQAVNATSMITRAISKLGDFIAAVEMDYNLDPNEDFETRLGKIKDENTKSKYKAFLAEQKRLEKFYEVERDIDPNNIETAQHFKNAILQELQHFRNIMYRTEGTSVTRVHSDDVIFKAMKLVEDFQWPLDPEELSRRRKITKKDQLMAELAERVVYDPRITFGGLNAEQRDQLAHCIATKLKLTEDERKNFLDEIKKLTPSHGIGPGPVLSELLYERDINDGLGTRALKSASNGIVTTVDLGINLAGAVLGTISPFRAWEAYSRREHVLATGINTERDPLLEAKAKEFAANLGGAMAAIATLKNIPPYNKSIAKLKALTAFNILVKMSDAEFNGDKTSLVSLLSPYHDMAQVNSARALLAELTRATDAFKENPSDPKNQANVNKALQNLSPKLIAPESEAGPDFVRSSVMGNMYELVGSISNVVEDMARRDPVLGLVALSSMSVGMAYVGIVGAHAGSTAAASASSKFAAAIAKTEIYPWFYHGISPLTAKSGFISKSVISFIDGLTVGKLNYLAMSMMRSAGTGQAGFSSEILDIMQRYPTEAVIGAAFMYALGASTIAATHEQAALGTFQVFDKMTVALKPAMIAYDQFIVPVVEMLHTEDSRVNPVIKAGMNQRLANLIALGIFESIPENQRGGIRLEELNATCLKVISDLKPGEARDIQARGVLEKLKYEFETHSQQAAIYSALDKMFSGNAQAAEAVQREAVAVRNVGAAPPASAGPSITEQTANLSQEIWKQLGESPDQETFLQCLAIAQEVAVERPAHSIGDIAKDAVKIMRYPYVDILSRIRLVTLNENENIDTPLQFLEKMYPKEANEFSAGLTEDQKKSPAHLNAKQEYLGNLFHQELLESKRDKTKLWELASKQFYFQLAVEKTTGKSFEDLRAQPVPAKTEGAGTKFVRATGKTMLGGVVRLIRLPFAAVYGGVVRPIMKAFGNPTHETMRAADSGTGYNDLTAVADGARALGNLTGRIFARMSEVVLTASSRVFRTLGATTVANALDRGTEWAHKNLRRLSLEKAMRDTVKRPDDVPWYRYSMGKVELVVPTKGGIQFAGGDIDRKTFGTVVQNYVKASTLTDSPLMFRSLNALEIIQDANLTPLNVLKSLFDWEATQIKKLMDEKGIPKNECDDYMFASLQHLFREEILACKTKDEAVFAAFTSEAAVGLLAQLGGADFDPTAPDPEVAKRAQMDRLLGRNVAEIDEGEKPVVSDQAVDEWSQVSADEAAGSNPAASAADLARPSPAGARVLHGSRSLDDDSYTTRSSSASAPNLSRPLLRPVSIDDTSFDALAPEPGFSAAAFAQKELVKDVRAEMQAVVTAYDKDIGRSFFRSDFMEKWVTAMHTLPAGTEFEANKIALHILETVFVKEAVSMRASNPKISDGDLLNALQTKYQKLLDAATTFAAEHKSTAAALGGVTAGSTLSALLTSRVASFSPAEGGSERDARSNEQKERPNAAPRGSNSSL